MAVESLVLRMSVAMLVTISVRSCAVVDLKGNLALKRKVVQSSTWANSVTSYTARHAVDGKNNLKVKSCACTRSEDNPWLRVELPRTYRVARVVIGYIDKYFQGSLAGAEIHVGNSLTNNGNDNPIVAVVNSENLSAKRKTEQRFHPTPGRYVNVMLPAKNKHLIICELEVYTFDEDDVQARKINLALKGRATQSSLANGIAAGFGLPQHAIDGNRNPDLYKGSCSHTEREKDPWWRVDLLGRHAIVSVSLTNRGDCCAERLNGAVIHVGNSLSSEGQKNPVCATVSSITAGETRSFSCSEWMDGRYVTIVVPGEDKILSMCEVGVYGFALDNGI
ncbi:fucolectin-1-like [Brachyhypopomus gauderio]|uniref:fucolectin-1-like n=1 Tax=Brachyhypopomus gauderio TaxID=698409 RepID=UPI0040413A16